MEFALMQDISVRKMGDGNYLQNCGMYGITKTSEKLQKNNTNNINKLDTITVRE